MKAAPVTFYTVDFQILVFTSASNSTHVLYVMVFVLWYSARESGGGRIWRVCERICSSMHESASISSGRWLLMEAAGLPDMPED